MNPPSVLSDSPAGERVLELTETFATHLERLKRGLDGNLDDASVDAAYPGFAAIATELLDRLGELKQTHKLSPQELQRLRAGFRAHPAVLPFFERPFNRDALAKRYGYAGDFEVIDQLLRLQVESSGLHRLYDRFLLQQPAVCAVRERYELILERLRGLLRGRAPDKRLRIASIGCGSAREFRVLIDEGLLENVDVYLVDTSSAALAFARDLLSDHPDSVRVHFRREDVVDYCDAHLVDLSSKLEGKVDFLYCLGVMDYLRAPVVRTSLKLLRRSVVAGGTCIVGNFEPGNPSRAYMEWLLEWRLYYRTEAEFRRLAGKIDARDEVSSFAVAGGVNHFLEVRRALPPRRPPIVEVDGARTRPEPPRAGAPSETRQTVEEHRMSVVRGLGLGSMLGALLYPMWILMDATEVLDPSTGEPASGTGLLGDPKLRICFAIRTGVMAYLLVYASFALFLSRRRTALTRLIWFGAGGHLAMGGGLLAIMWTLDVFGTNYHAGLIMVLIAISTLTPWRPIRTVLEVLLIAVGYVGLALYRYRDAEAYSSAVIQSIVFVAGSAVLLSISVYLVPIYRRPYLPQAAVAAGEREARRTISGGAFRGMRVWLAGVRAGVRELWARNRVVIGVAATSFCLLVILLVMVFGVLPEGSGFAELLRPAEGGRLNEVQKLILGSFVGVFSTVVGGGILIAIRHAWGTRSRTRSDPADDLL